MIAFYKVDSKWPLQLNNISHDKAIVPISFTHIDQKIGVAAAESHPYTYLDLLHNGFA